MSHVTLVKTEFKDLEALKAALPFVDPGLEFKEGQTTFKWFGRFMGDSPVPEGMNAKDYGKCIHAIGFRKGDNRHGSAYEVGIVKLPGQKSYSIVYDFWAGGYGLETAIGKDAVKLKREYGAQVAAKKARAQGYAVSITRTQAGYPKLVCTQR